jgi:hypothetical protein
MSRAAVGCADRHRDHEARERLGSGEMRQQPQRTGVCPLKVVEHQQRRSNCRKQPSGRLEQQPALDVGIGEVASVGPAPLDQQLGNQA